MGDSLPSPDSKILFQNLPGPLKKLLLDYQKNKLIEIDLTSGIKLNTKILENKDVYDQALVFIQNNYKNLSKELIENFFNRLYRNPSYFVKLYGKPIVRFDLIENDFEYLRFKYKSFPMEENLTSTSSGNILPHLKDKSNDISKVSLPHSILDLSALYQWLAEKKWEYCIWISKSDRDHNKDCLGQLDPNGKVFQKLIKSFNLTFSNPNGWETIIYKKEGLYFSWSVNKNGYIRFWINDYLSWELFIKLLHEKLQVCSYTPDEFKEFIEVLEDNEKKKLFYLETANVIGPREVIEREFNKACLVYQQVYFNGLYLPVVVKIDKSKGPYEIEFQGAEGPTKRLQDLTVRDVETVQSLGVMEFKQDSMLQLASANNQQLVLLQKNILPKQDLLGELSLIDIKGDIRNIILEEKLNEVLKGFPKLKETIISLDSESSEDRVKIREVLANLIVQLLNLDSNIQDNLNETKSSVESAFIDTSNHIYNAKEEIVQKIESSVETINTNLDNLQKYISKEFKQTNNRIKNNLYLTLRKMDNMPEITARQLSEELNVSQKTIYSYLKKLQDKKLIISEIKKSKTPGRPGKVFKLNSKKIMKLLKKRNK
ncbi:MAG: HTH domain-containing protein [Candidatus Odinarchaeota archaeon]